MTDELGMPVPQRSTADEPKERESAQPYEEPEGFSSESGCQALARPSPTDKFSDVANAERLINKYRNDLRFVNYLGWHYWDGSIWRKDPHDAIRFGQSLGSLIANEIRDPSEDREFKKWAKRSEQRPQIESALKLAKPFLSLEPDSMDKFPHLLGIGNGTFDLRSGKLRSRQRDDYITKQIEIFYDPLATCRTWEATISRVLGNDQDMVDYFQRVCGYCLTGSTREQVLFLLIGPGANGKSTVVMTLQSILGPYAKQAAPNLLMKTNFDRHPTELADLKGARLAVVSETPDGGKLNENLVKQLTGGDLVKGRFMRKDFFEFRPTHKFMIMSNHKPAIAGDDLAIWRRIQLISFNVVIPKEEQDTMLYRKLLSEKEGILSWCIDGCRHWLKQGLNPPATVTAATDAYKSQQDIFAQFLDECCKLGPHYQFNASKLYVAYRTWCCEAGLEPKSQVGFWDSLSNRGITKKRTSMGFLYLGIALDRRE